MEGLSELRAHLNVQVVLLLEAFFARLHSVLDHLLELGALDRVENIRHPLAVQAVPVALIREVPEGGYRGLGQLDMLSTVMPSICGTEETRILSLRIY